MNEVLDFIKKRFPNDCNWLNGNCYYFSQILKSRFPSGDICYDVINGHFVFKYKSKYYDWYGEVSKNGKIVRWDSFEYYDSLQKQRIIRDCIL